jgi:hypothetical protein
MPSEEIFYHAAGRYLWFHLEGGPSSRRASSWSDGRDRDYDQSGPMRGARGIRHPPDTLGKIWNTFHVGNSSKSPQILN